MSDGIKGESSRKLPNERPFLQRGLSMADVERYKEKVKDVTYEPKKPKVIRRNSIRF